MFTCVVLAFAPVLLFAFSPSVAEGQVVISEIMYDLEGADAGREWIEVFNAGSAAVVLTEWKLFESETNHGITAYAGGESLSPGTYAVIADNPAKFLEDRSYSGLLFDSAFSLSNSGEALLLRCCGSGEGLADKDGVSYDPASAAGDGNSLHRISVAGTSFSAGAPTPGSGTLKGTSVSNSTSSGESNAVSSNDTSNAEQTTSSTVSSSVSLSRVSAGSDRAVTLGVDTRFEGVAYSGTRAVEAQFRWNFGDGTTALGQSVLHRWEYAGRYAVVLEATRFGETASHRITVSVESPQLSFEILPEGGVAIENFSNRDLDISGWRVTDTSVSFVFPPNSIILKNASVRFSLGGLRLNALSPAKLLYPNGSVAFSTASDSSEEHTLNQEVTATSSAPVFFEEISEFDAEDEYMFSEERPLEDEVAGESIVQSEDAMPPENARFAAGAAGAVSRASPMWWLGILFVLGLGGYAVFAARRLRRRDWTIIEDTSE